jgi:hypothetical protein
MDATFLPAESNSIFRREPSAEVDAAWDKISTLRPLAIGRKELIKLGYDPEQTAMWPEDLGIGRDKYIARMDVFHQLHCLNTLRKEAYFSHYYGYGNRTEKQEIHLSHCLHLLLQNLMCTANVDIITHFWTETRSLAWPDFSINHKCRDFDSLLKWQEENSLSIDTFEHTFKPPGTIGHKMSDRLKELFPADDLTSTSAALKDQRL